jgi:iron complex outermembrane receptor protein
VINGICTLFGGASIKEGEGFGFRRLPSETSNVVLSIFPNGFQPVLNSKIYDFSYAVGTKYQNNNWTLDLSNTFGSNVFNYDVSNTNNASMGAQSPTEFNAGSHGFLQNTFNVDVSKKIDNFNIAFGGEWRFEQYQIKSGEEASYKNYGLVSGAVGGAQSFIGFSNDNA